MPRHMRHGIEQHHAQQNQTDADNPNEISFLTENTTLTKAVKTSPTPAQMAYAVASGMVFSVIDKAQKHTEKLTITPIEGHSLLNPPLSLSMEEPQTSLKNCYSQKEPVHLHVFT